MNLILGVSKPYFGAYIANIIIWKAHLADQIESQKTASCSKFGINFSEDIGYFLKLEDGIIIIDKYEKLNRYETTNN